MEPNETLSILQDINASMTPSRRLPLEILIHIKDEVHKPNTVWENIRSTWTAESIYSELDPTLMHWEIDREDRRKLLDGVVLDPDRMKYHIVEDLPSGLSVNNVDDSLWMAQVRNLGCHISSADLLYRMRCFFPEILIRPSNGYTMVWSADIRHKQTGFAASMAEHKASGKVYVGSSMITHSRNRERTDKYHEMFQVYFEDFIELLNALVGTVDIHGDTQLAYFHPAAVASRPSNEQRYIAVPIATRDRVYDADEVTFQFWLPVYVSPDDLSSLSSFRSILPNLKYNIKSRMLDLKGTPLTEVISSALLWYRLLCKYQPQDGRLGEATIPGSSSDFPITGSVWQMKLRHEDYHNALILFMDDHGLFDIRANEEAMEVMDFIIPLINTLFSDDITHPYDLTLAGALP